MTLTAFLRENVYFPLGGSRKGKGRTYLNILLVYLVSGIWHGAGWTFILWGMLHGLAQVAERLWGRGPIAIAVVLAHVFQISPDWPCTAGELSFEGSNEGPPVSRHTRHLIVMVANDHAGAV